MEFTFKHSKTFRYETLNGTISAKTVIYVLHGYGHLVKYFIQKFESIQKDILIVAPEGMHRFYLNGTSGKVGASWMTKEAREIDISDNIEWLNALDAKISNEYPIENRILLGFSQGGSTALRWQIFGNVQFNSLIVWASDIPPDLIDKTENLKSQPNKHFAIGNKDEYCNNEEQALLIDQYKALNFNISEFVGGHSIHIETLNSIIRQIKID